MMSELQVNHYSLTESVSNEGKIVHMLLASSPKPTSNSELLRFFVQALTFLANPQKKWPFIYKSI